MSNHYQYQQHSTSRSFHQAQFPSGSPLPAPVQHSIPHQIPLQGPSPKSNSNSDSNSNPVSNSLINLLVRIILTALNSDLLHSALFFSERLHALIPSSELAVWLLSLSLLRTGNHQATVHLLRNTPIFIPHHPSRSSPNPKGKARLVEEDPFSIQHSLDEIDHSLWEWNHQDLVRGKQRAAHSASARCALVYSKACNLINRPKEGLEVYLKVIDQVGLPNPDEDALLNSVASPLPSHSASYTLLATLAYKSHEYERATEFYRRALAAPDGHLCWEAFEGLCQTAGSESEIDVDAIFTDTALDDFLSGYMDLDDSIIHGALGPQKHIQSSLSEYHPPPPPNPTPSTHHHPASPGKDSFRILGVNGASHHHPSMLIDNSFSENGHSHTTSFGVSSFEHFQYPSQPPNQSKSGGIPRQPGNLGPIKKANGTSSSSNGHRQPIPQRLFQVERSEAVYDSLPISSTPNLQQGFGFDHYNPNIPSPMPAPSPLPFDGFTPASNPIIEPLPPLVPIQQGTRGLPGVKRTRSQTNSNEQTTLTSLSPLPPVPPLLPAQELDEPMESVPNPSPAYLKKPKTGGVREKKRVKSNGNIFDPPAFERDSEGREAKAEAVAWVKAILRKFGAAYIHLSRFRCEGVLEELSGLPEEQKRSWRVYCLIGRARFEMLDYKSAEVAFRKAREAFPHLVKHMDIYSTLLWHTRNTTSLSYLSQELQLVNASAPETWIATGNLFSRLDDHPHALACFRRATQLSATAAYAYTLAGHECLILQEYTRSTVFFRESLRREGSKNYTAYFGLGECYFKQEKYLLAKYFFETAHAINPSNPLILCGIGKTLERIGKTEEAVEVYGDALELGDGNNGVAIVRFLRAKALVGLGNYLAAKTDLLDLARTVPTEYNVRFLLGKVHGLLGEKVACVRELTYAQDLEPKAAGTIKRILAELEEVGKARGDEMLETGVGVSNLSTYSI
ncbi:hypothetical protein CROQUDRAFT_671103 [Cronartium quercuum f. sp. fusiforme G11]|uniref:Uncharacterized protein n=1 Tax=Cronartium quercuum f. sp. fusiforme G11 TaxID=708437 RepID=A0A9P6NN23_9BASI|nr:hypothetical protein CROQUDRAFT_671103 [Cronartium quercuum f. sp. fusiforme G11]